MAIELHSILASNLKKYRDLNGLTQDELSDRAGVAYSTVAKLEQGTIMNPTLLTVASLADAMDITVDDLIEHSFAKSSEKTNQIKFVYFDMNGVLLKDYHRAFTKIAEQAETYIDKVEAVFWQFNDPNNSGDMSMREFNKRMGEALGMKGFDWVPHYMSVVKPLKETHELIKELAKDYQVGLLTNTFPGARNLLKEKGKLKGLKFNRIVDSSEVKAVKPDIKIYQIAEEKAAVKPAEILFVDDNHENIRVAGHRGWHTVWFDTDYPKQSIERIREALEA